MTEKLDHSRRTLVKLLSNAPLLPLAGGGATAALLSACGGGSNDTASPTAQRLASTLASTTATSATYTYPGLDPNFDTAIAGLNLVEDMTFGSSAVASGSAVGVAITSLTDLATLFYPLQGVFSATGGHISGTGPTVINNEVQRYATTFNAQNHVFETDGLRLQPVLSAGEFNSYLRGTINYSTGNGFTAGAEGVSTPTLLADIGLTATDLASIEIGTCVTSASYGIAVVVAKDTSAGTITFEAVTGGTKTAYKSNWHLTFTKFAFSRVAADVVNGTTTTIQFKTPVASSVVAGMYSLGVNCGTTYAYDFHAYDRAKVLSISADRLSVTFDKPVHYGASTLKVLSSTGTTTGDGVLFVPGLSSGEIWSKRGYGPQLSGHQAQAVQVEITMPSLPQFGGGAYYNKAQVEGAMATYAGTTWGYWPAVWMYNFKPAGDVTGYTLTGSEVDMLELFTHMWGGQSTWTGYLHTQTYTRQVAMQSGSTTIARNGGTWKTSTASGSLQTANAAQLLMPTPIASGTRRTISVIWTRDKIIHYLDGVPVCESNWAVDTSYPHQLGINVACGSLSNSYAAALFFPQTNAHATGQFLKIHSIKTWEL